MLRMFVPVIAAALALWVPSAASAHFIWIDLPTAGSGNQAKVWFSETPEAGSGELAAKITATEARLFTESGDPQPIKLELRQNDADGTGELSGDIAAADRARAEAQFHYGLFAKGDKAIDLHYYAKCIRVADAAALASLAKSNDLALDLVPEVNADGAVVRVVWQGKALPGAEVVIVGGDGEPTRTKSDDQGLVRLAGPTEGRHAIYARYAQPDSAGAIDGKDFSQTWRVATLILALGDAAPSTAASTGEATPDEMLAAARNGRAIWDKFPGFTCKVHGTIDSVVADGKMTMGADGAPKFEGLDALDSSTLNQQMRLLATHRLPGGVEAQHASFVDEDRNHPLGRLLKLEGDDAESSYRVRDNVVTEVSRNMGPRTRFTISVLEVTRNAEHKYLPRSFTASYWEKESGLLRSNEAYFQTWKRLGPYDLPEKLVVVLTGKGTRRVLELDFSEHELLNTTTTAAR